MPKGIYGLKIEPVQNNPHSRRYAHVNTTRNPTGHTHTLTQPLSLHKRGELSTHTHTHLFMSLSHCREWALNLVIIPSTLAAREMVKPCDGSSEESGPSPAQPDQTCGSVPTWHICWVQKKDKVQRLSPEPHTFFFSVAFLHLIKYIQRKERYIGETFYSRVIKKHTHSLDLWTFRTLTSLTMTLC